MKHIVRAVFLVIALAGAAAAQKTWIGGGTGTWGAGANWSPAGVPGAADAVTVNTGGSVTINNVPSTSILQLFVTTAGTNLTLQAGTSGNVLTIAGSTGTDFTVASGCTLAINTANVLNLTLPTGVTGQVDGSITVSGAAHKILPADASSLTFVSGSSFTQTTGFTSNIFNNAGTANAVTFASGSTFTHEAGANPFGLGQPNSRVVFSSGSSYVYTASVGALAASGRTYPNLTITGGGTTTPTGGSTLTIQNDLTVNGGSTLNIGNTGTVLISGNVLVTGNSTLNVTGAGQAQTITGNLTVNSGSTFSNNSTATQTWNGNVTSRGTLNSNSFTLGSARTLTIANGGVFQIGNTAAAFTITANGTVIDSNATNSGIRKGATVTSGTLTLAATSIYRLFNTNGFSGAGNTSVLSDGGANSVTISALPAGSRVVYNALGSQVVTSATPYSSLEITGSGTKTPNALTTVNRYLYLTAGTLDNATNQISLGANAITRRAAGTITTTPTYAGKRSVQYVTAGTTAVGPEFPTTIDSLIFPTTGAVILNVNDAVDRTINDVFVLRSNSQRVNMNGNLLALGQSGTGLSLALSTPDYSFAAQAYVFNATIRRYVNDLNTSFVVPLGFAGAGTQTRRLNITFTGVPATNAIGTYLDVYTSDVQFFGGIPGLDNTSFPITTPVGDPDFGTDQITQPSGVSGIRWAIDPSVAVASNYNLQVDAAGVVDGTGSAFTLTIADKLRLLKRANTQSGYTIQGGYTSGTAAGGFVSILHTGLSGFSQYSFGVLDGDGGTLPVTWLSVAATREANGAKVTWSTASELNNERFEVQRSSTAQFASYTTVGTVAGRGTSSQVNRYSFLDADFSGVAYYRIRQVDYDGTSSLSRIVGLNEATEWAVYPNPAVSPVQITGTGLSDVTESVALTVIAPDGRVALDVVAPASSLTERLNSALSSLSSGLYVVRIGRQTIRLVKP